MAVFPAKNQLTPLGLIKSADPRSGKSNQFAVFGEAWIELQVYVAAALNLPDGSDKFAARYGEYKFKEDIEKCINAMVDLRDACGEFGSPQDLRSKLIDNPDYLNSETPPRAIFDHVAWTGQSVHKAAVHLGSLFEVLRQTLEETNDPQRKVELIKEYLLKKSVGAIATANAAHLQARTLVQQVAIFEPRISQCNQSVSAYTSTEGDFYEKVSEDAALATASIETYQRAADEAHSEWLDYTIAAVTTSVPVALMGLCFVPFTAGLSMVPAVGLGAGLGAKAAAAEAEYEAMKKLMNQAKDESRLKKKLALDLSGFNTGVSNLAPRLSSFLVDLQGIEGAWNQLNLDLLQIAESVTPDNFADDEMWAEVQLRETVQFWNSVDETAKEFTGNALIDARGGLS
jgi:hypothetical protein